MKPRVAIPLPTSSDLAYNRLNWQAYADAVIAAGGAPVEFGLGLAAREAKALASTCQAILLPGSPADVDPAVYGQERDEASAPADEPRESLDRLLLEHAYDVRMPILCVCFGVQFLNVFHGGTLIQDLTVMPVNHSAGRAVAVAHSVSVAPASLLGGMVDAAEAPEVEEFLRLSVNSSHHQAVGIPGAGLKVSARCPQDAVIEAIEGAYDEEDELRHFVLGVQWHPERTTSSSATSRAIFNRLMREARAWHASAVVAR